MLNLLSLLKTYRPTAIFLISIIFGSLLGIFSKESGLLLGSYLDHIILALVFFIFLEVPFENILKGIKNIKFISVAWATNFILIPIIGFVIASLFLQEAPLFLIGLFIYFMAPCTDWFLAFTKIAKGDTGLGSVLLPINMITQLLLYPVYLFIFVGSTLETNISTISNTLLNWFLLPFATATILRLVLRKLTKENTKEKIANATTFITEGILAILIISIFATNIAKILNHLEMLTLVLAAVFTFFVIIYIITEKISRHLHFSHPMHVLYTMTTSARNSPLMLGITIAAFPQQPLIYAALIIGMLVEFPYLAIVSAVLQKPNKKPF